ncbi:poly-beta-hydroxybutyrate polymerase domain protein [Burkholderia cepacia]|nr:poly-beta-hydroxybutyrate polymerase domain protein [Burkholderia cepacia]
MNPFATFQFPTSFPFQVPSMPDFGAMASPFAGLKLPAAAIPPSGFRRCRPTTRAIAWR